MTTNTQLLEAVAAFEAAETELDAAQLASGEAERRTNSADHKKGVAARKLALLLPPNDGFSVIVGNRAYSRVAYEKDVKYQRITDWPPAEVAPEATP